MLPFFRPAPGGATVHCSGSFFSRHWWRASPRIQPLRIAHITSLLRRPSAPSRARCVCVTGRRDERGTRTGGARVGDAQQTRRGHARSSTHTSCVCAPTVNVSNFQHCHLLWCRHRSRVRTALHGTTSALSTLVGRLAVAPLPLCALLRAARSRATALLRYCAIARFCQLTCLLCVSVGCLWQYRQSRRWRAA
jgi:hypothetical protein